MTGTLVLGSIGDPGSRTAADPDDQTNWMRTLVANFLPAIGDHSRSVSSAVHLVDQMQTDDLPLLLKTVTADVSFLPIDSSSDTIPDLRTHLHTTVIDLLVGCNRRELADCCWTAAGPGQDTMTLPLVDCWSLVPALTQRHDQRTRAFDEGSGISFPGWHCHWQPPAS